MNVYTRQGDVDWTLHAEQGLGGAIYLPAIGAEIQLSFLYEGIPMPESGE